MHLTCSLDVIIFTVSATTKGFQLKPLVSSAAFSLSLNASSVVCYVQHAIQTQQFVPFQIKHGGPPGPEIFSSVL